MIKATVYVEVIFLCVSGLAAQTSAADTNKVWSSRRPTGITCSGRPDLAAQRNNLEPLGDRRWGPLAVLRADPVFQRAHLVRGAEEPPRQFHSVSVMRRNTLG